jgi:hypothetical protein
MVCIINGDEHGIFSAVFSDLHHFIIKLLLNHKTKYRYKFNFVAGTKVILRNVKVNA